MGRGEAGTRYFHSIKSDPNFFRRSTQTHIPRRKPSPRYLASYHSRIVIDRSTCSVQATSRDSASKLAMADRGSHRGGGGGGGGRGGGYRGRGGGGGGGRGGHGGGQGGAGGDRERPKKENILDLGKYMDKKITVKFNGGREVTGTLKGYDALMNLVLDDVEEVMRDDEGKENTQSLGLVVARGTLLVLVSPVDGSEPIANPFAQPEED
ncbi:hypothetical protein BN1723_005635 [Verticillium longisporum]|uniref:Sm domain-containing protein n=1 Tax=Verticillium longisporum TaxID=100787 RepID=A0A0G4NAB3_VERLO|nr:hypothetical protein BN1723_005635 [Verticillium longisporum]